MNQAGVQRDIVYRGRKIQVAVDSFCAADGTPLRRDVVLHPGAVAILPVLDADHICLIRQDRPVIGETLLEIPAGTLELGEPPDQAAVRELAEETGYQAGRWRKLIEFFPSPGVISERSHLYVAQDLTPGPLQLEKDESLEPCIIAWTDAQRWALDGTIGDAKTLLAILLWAQLR
jgi:ADP-ribose pyrophosphatase